MASCRFSCTCIFVLFRVLSYSPFFKPEMRIAISSRDVSVIHFTFTYTFFSWRFVSFPLLLRTLLSRASSYFIIFFLQVYVRVAISSCLPFQPSCQSVFLPVQYLHPSSHSLFFRVSPFYFFFYFHALRMCCHFPPPRPMPSNQCVFPPIQVFRSPPLLVPFVPYSSP